MPSYQSAYRANHSCEAALLKVTNDILWSLEKQQVTAMMALDLSAAFDTVDHDMLLEVLNKRFGLNGTALKWCDSYLRPRGFKVNVNKQYSSPKDSTSRFMPGPGPLFGICSILSRSCSAKR